MAGVEVLQGIGGERMEEVDIENLKQTPDLVAYLRQCAGVPGDAKYVKVMENSTEATEPLEKGQSWQELGSPTSLLVLMQSRAMEPEGHARVMDIVRPRRLGPWVQQNSPGQQQFREALQEIHPHAKDENGQPLLHKMIALGARSWLVEELLYFGADCNLTSATGETAMETAVLSLGFNSIPVCKLLTRERPICKAILLCAVKCDDMDSLEALMQIPRKKMEMSYSDWMEVLKYACKQHSTRPETPFEYLLKKVGISIEQRDIEDLFDTSIASSHSRALEAILELDDGVAPVITAKHLNEAIKKQDNKLLEYLLSKINPIMADKYRQIYQAHQWTWLQLAEEDLHWLRHVV